jgi:hypothetical protein
VNLKVRNLKLPPQSLADSLKQTIAKVPELDLSYVIKDDTILIIAN